MKKKPNIFARIGGTIMLPAAMFIIMFILCRANGKDYFGTWVMWRSVLVNVAASASCALGIGLQFKNGRFDFSGGAIMLLSAIFCGTVSQNYLNSNIWIFCILCIVTCVILSVIVSVIYVYGRLPIIIATIGLALLYESLTCIIFNGSGIMIVSNMQLGKLSSFPCALIPLSLSMIVYGIYSYVTTSGKQSQLLAMNQQSAVNIGINEKKNVIISYIYSGILFGFATMIYTTAAKHSASFTSLSTAGELFSNILPVFIGLMLAGFCGDLIGTVMGSLTLCLLSYGLSALYKAELGSAVSTIITGLFILVLNVVSAQGSSWVGKFQKIFRKSLKKPEF